MNKLKLRKLENFVFDKENHTYQLADRLLVGVTTVLGVRAKDFLKWWTVKEMYNFLLPKLKDIQGISEKEWDKILLSGRKAWLDKSKKALVSGGIAHEWIEKYIKNRIVGRIAKEFLPDDPKATASIKAFIDWEDKHNVEWLASELCLASVNELFAGTIDFVARINGVLTLGDFKTSNQTSEDVALQTAAYHILLDENLSEGESRPEQRVTIRIPKDGSHFDYQRIDTDLEFDKSTFLRLREIYRWNIYIDNNFKVGDENKIKLQK